MQTVLSNGNFEDPKFLKWAQIFYGITFVLMSLGQIHSSLPFESKLNWF